MKKRIRNLSLIVAFALLAAFIPLLRGSGTVAYADGDFLIENGVLKKYNGTSSKVVIPDLEILYQTDENIYTAKGEEIFIFVEAKGLDVKYQWYYMKSGQSGWSLWKGRTHAEESVTPNDTWDGIKLYCKLTDANGESINSEVITIHLVEPLRIIEQPKSQAIQKGASVTVSVKANRENVIYQWYFRKKGQNLFSVWKGRTHASETCTPNDTWDGIQLYCEVSESNDQNGEFVSSEIATIILSDTPVLAIVQQPESKAIKLGESVTISLKATGDGLKYQWYFKKAGQTSFSKWNNRTHASETVTPNATWDGIKLYCVVKDSAGKSVQSDTITITVKCGPVITQQPVSQSVSLGQTITVSLKATGDGLTYQWYFKKAGQTSFSKWNNRTNASETVTPNDTWDGIQLYCVVKDGAGNSVKSDTITISVKNVPVITNQPKNQTITLGQPVTVSLNATGSGLTYQWYYKKVGQSGFSIWKGHTSASETCTPNATWNGIQLYCIIKDSAGNTVKSDTITVTIK